MSALDRFYCITKPRMTPFTSSSWVLHVSVTNNCYCTRYENADHLPEADLVDISMGKTNKTKCTFFIFQLPAGAMSINRSFSSQSQALTARYLRQEQINSWVIYSSNSNNFCDKTNIEVSLSWKKKWHLWVRLLFNLFSDVMGAGKLEFCWPYCRISKPWYLYDNFYLCYKSSIERSKVHWWVLRKISIL